MSIKVSEEKTLVLLEDYLQKDAKQFTIQDASAKTGLPVLETEHGVKSLMEKYDCKLRVTDQGDLIYDFGQDLHRRYAKTTGEYLRQFGQWVWKIFKVFYKSMIAVVLIAYFIVFFLILIAALVAMAAASEDSDGMGSVIGAVFRGLIEGLAEIFVWDTVLRSQPTYQRIDDYGYDYKHYKERPPVFKKATKQPIKKGEKGFMASVYDFVFGPPRVEPHEFANRQEVATFLRKHNGLVCISEIQALAGWERDEAENFMTECLAAFDGRAEIYDTVLYGDFDEFLRQKNQHEGAPIVYYWDEYEPEFDLTGNKTWRNVGITLINLFNMGMAGAALNFFAQDGGSLGSVGAVLLGWIPLVYSILFFMIPVIRYFVQRPLRKQRIKNNIRKRLMKVIFQEHTARLSLEKLTNTANQLRKQEKILSEAEVKEVMQNCIYDLGGDSYVNNKGEIMYHFERLDKELDVIEQLRKEKGDGKIELGDIIFKT